MASVLPEKNYARIPVTLKLPDLIEVQLDSFERLKAEGLGDLLHEISPIESYNKGMKLFFPSRGPESTQWGLKYWFGDPKHTIEDCVERDLTYSSPLYVSVLLAGPEVPEPIKQDIFLGDFPVMTDRGTIIVNGIERVVVSQLVRSAGVFFTHELVRNRKLFGAKVIPNRGAWLELETDANNVIWVKIDRQRKVHITALVRALGYGANPQILDLFGDDERLSATLQKDPTHSEAEGLIEIYKRQRPGVRGATVRQDSLPGSEPGGQVAADGIADEGGGHLHTRAEAE